MKQAASCQKFKYSHRLCQVVALQLARFLKVRGVRRKVRDRSARELVDVRHPATRCLPQLVNTLHKPSCFLCQYRYRFPGFAPRLAVVVGITPAMRAVPYRIEGGQHRHGVEVRGGHPVVAVEVRPDIARVHLVLAVGVECRVLAGIAQRGPVLW